jgi:hypothetical protein
MQLNTSAALLQPRASRLDRTASTLRAPPPVAQSHTPTSAHASASTAASHSAVIPIDPETAAAMPNDAVIPMEPGVPSLAVQLTGAEVSLATKVASKIYAVTPNPATKTVSLTVSAVGSAAGLIAGKVEGFGNTATYGAFGLITAAGISALAQVADKILESTGVTGKFKKWSAMAGSICSRDGVDRKPEIEALVHRLVERLPDAESKEKFIEGLTNLLMKPPAPNSMLIAQMPTMTFSNMFHSIPKINYSTILANLTQGDVGHGFAHMHQAFLTEALQSAGYLQPVSPSSPAEVQAQRNALISAGARCMGREELSQDLRDPETTPEKIMEAHMELGGHVHFHNHNEYFKVNEAVMDQFRQFDNAAVGQINRQAQVTQALLALVNNEESAATVRQTDPELLLDQLILQVRERLAAQAGAA